ncbi:MAG: FGGY-family carbohydrate kinase [Vitreimonas sp.]
MSGTVVVFDVGKTNLKLIAFDAASGGEIWARTCPNAPRQDGPYPHADIEAVESVLLDGLDHAARGANGALDGVAVTTHGASGALLTGERLALPVLDYEYDGPEETAEAYRALRPPFAETLSPRLPGGLNLGAQLLWQQLRFPEQFAAATTFVTYPQFWAFKLCGVAATEVTSLGCHTDLWRPVEARFSSLVARAGWAELMAPTRHAGDVLAPMRAGLAARLGLKTPPPVYCGIQDSNASLMPYLSAARPRSIVSSGTWAIFFSLGGSFARLNEERDMLANVNAHGAPVLSARFMGGREFDILTAGAQGAPSLRDIARVLDAQVMALPSFVSACGPFPHGEGRWTSAPENLAPGERLAAASLYLALMSNVCLDLLEASGETIIQGPFVRNAFFCDALATLTGRPLFSTEGATATGAGAARLMLPHLAEKKGALAPGLPSPLRASLLAYAAAWARIAGA